MELERLMVDIRQLRGGQPGPGQREDAVLQLVDAINDVHVRPHANPQRLLGARLVGICVGCCCLAIRCLSPGLPV